MLVFIVKRLISLSLSLIFASGVIFFMLDVMPGDPASVILGLNATPETLAALRSQLGLDDPAMQRYVNWVWGMLHGELGISHTYRVPVAEMVTDRLLISFPLAIYALVLSILIAFPLGIVSAMRHDTMMDRGVMCISQLGLAIPDFWFAMLLVGVFSITMRWFPAGGFPGWEAGFLPCMKALLLPAVALALPQSSILIRVLRSSMREVMSKDYIRTARAKGATRWYTMWSHALGNALVPVINIIGLQFSFLLAGTIIVENMFVLPGLGQMVFQGVTQRDFIVVRSVVMLLVCAVIMMTFWVDLACATVDPRLRRRV